jgi:hypothetical protein
MPRQHAVGLLVIRSESIIQAASSAFSPSEKPSCAGLEATGLVEC